MSRRAAAGDKTRNLEAKPGEQLVGALRMLFDLLEAYAPIWYTERHHQIASAALARVAQVGQVWEPKVKRASSKRKPRKGRLGIREA